MSSLFFWFVYFTLDDVYKVKVVFILVLVRATGQDKFMVTCLNQFNLSTKSTHLFLQQKGIGMPSVNKSGFCLLDIQTLPNFGLIIFVKHVKQQGQAIKSLFQMNSI